MTVLRTLEQALLRAWSVHDLWLGEQEVSADSSEDSGASRAPRMERARFVPNLDS